MSGQSIVGFLILLIITWGLSENRWLVRLRTLLSGVVLQMVLALIFLKHPGSTGLLLVLNSWVLLLQRATEAGTVFVFGYLGGGEVPFEVQSPGGSFILAFRALPLILIVSALTSLFFYWNILPPIVRVCAWALQRTMNIGGAVGLGAAANIFVGMIEAPLLVRPYLKNMTRSELFAVMTCGMATIAGTVMILYATVLDSTIPNVLGHLLAASIISAPAALTVAHVMIPETQPRTEARLVAPQVADGPMDAVSKGTLEGVRLLLNIVAMLVVLVALVNLVNECLAFLPSIDGEPVALERLLGYCLAPMAWLLGLPWSEARVAGSLMGTKTILNELIAYLEMASLPESALSHRSRLIMTYALCGFANFGSLGIMIGGMGTLIPERRREIVALGSRSIVGGLLATLMTGAVVGIFY